MNVFRKAPRGLSYRNFSSSLHKYHSNPLGLPKKAAGKGQGLPIKKRIPGVNKVVLVSSGKGGVGKSTVTVNLAMAMSLRGKRVGILDADVFGPSIPTMMKLNGEPRLSSDGKLLPLSNYGVETMSMGYMIKPDNPIVWRGLMVMKAMEQLLFDVKWSNLDVLVVDMPPGTGDTQLSVGQQIKVDAAVIVSTPQDVALADAVKGISMFEKMRIPIAGLVQNMSFYVCPDCQHEAHIFGNDGAKRVAQDRGLKTLGSIPLSEEICLHSDGGKPVVLDESNQVIRKHYFDVADQVLKFVTL